MLGGAVDDTTAEHELRDLGRIGAPLRGDGVGLALLRQDQAGLRQDLTVLEDGRSVDEDESPPCRRSCRK